MGHTLRKSLEMAYSHAVPWGGLVASYDLIDFVDQFGKLNDADNIVEKLADFFNFH
jgi:hypothetical protein